MISFLFALLAGEPATIPPHPFMGIAVVCVQAGNDAPACTQLASRARYDDKGQCMTAMADNVNTLGAALHHDHPEWNLDIRYDCIPDRNQYNG